MPWCWYFSDISSSALDLIGLIFLGIYTIKYCHVVWLCFSIYNHDKLFSIMSEIVNWWLMTGYKHVSWIVPSYLSVAFYCLGKMWYDCNECHELGNVDWSYDGDLSDLLKLLIFFILLRDRPAIFFQANVLKCLELFVNEFGYWDNFILPNSISISFQVSNLCCSMWLDSMISSLWLYYSMSLS